MGLPPRIAIPILAVFAVLFLGVLGWFLRIGFGTTGSAFGPGTTAGSATFDPAKAATTSDIALPAVVAPFDSGPVQPGQGWSHSFTAPGTYQYIGMPNEALGMRGTVMVSAPPPPPPG